MSVLKRTHHEMHIEWTAHNIFQGIEAGDLKSVQSPPFVFGPCLLRLKLSGYFLHNPEATTLGVKIHSSTKSLLYSVCPLKITYGLKNLDGTTEHLGMTIIKREEEESNHRFDKLSMVMRQKVQQLPDVATITFTLEVETLHDTESPCKRLKREDVLSQNFKDAFADKLGCDTIIHVKDKEFPAHKVVLIARSKVFAAMFQHDTSVKKTHITIMECDPDSFQEFLEYLYCGELDRLSVQNALHLYETSEKFDMPDLRLLCLEVLLVNWSVETFCDVVSFADKYAERRLESAAQDFFNRKSNDIVQTSDWDHFRRIKKHLSDRLMKGLREMAEAKLSRSIARAEYLLTA